jgi:hypothetical membrane protein
MSGIRPRLCSVSGLLAVGIYLAAAAAARPFFPAAFTPWGNWLSDLGNVELNPAGALFYRLGGILGGSGLVVFFLALDGRRWGGRRVVRVLSLLVRLFGTIASVSFILTGVFPEDMMPMHSWFSIATYAAFGTATALTGIAVLLGAALPRPVAVLCVAAWGFDIASAVLGQTRWLEWVVVGFLVAFVLALALAPRHRRVPSGSGRATGSSPRC